LPPGPINNPGKNAILAALYPENHKYLFFVADGKGGHRFSNTYAEHLKKVNEYRKSLKSKSN
ncbi:MAG TPA: endolytic transglycosylase MltG, partial [Ignavibacteriaceae bacterium]|nr:endolytic transglycosylase MltG [Ignavibacteriaceae bacterium]